MGVDKVHTTPRKARACGPGLSVHLDMQVLMQLLAPATLPSLKDKFHRASLENPALPDNCSLLRAPPACDRQVLLSVPQLMPWHWILHPCS